MDGLTSESIVAGGHRGPPTAALNKESEALFAWARGVINQVDQRSSKAAVYSVSRAWSAAVTEVARVLGPPYVDRGIATGHADLLCWLAVCSVTDARMRAMARDLAEGSKLPLRLEGPQDTQLRPHHRRLVLGWVHARMRAYVDGAASVELPWTNDEAGRADMADWIGIDLDLPTEDAAKICAAAGWPP